MGGGSEAYEGRGEMEASSPGLIERIKIKLKLALVNRSIKSKLKELRNLIKRKVDLDFEINERQRELDKLIVRRAVLSYMLNKKEDYIPLLREMTQKSIEDVNKKLEKINKRLEEIERKRAISYIQ